MNDNPSRRGAAMIDRELHERGADGGASLTTRFWRSARGWPGRQTLASWGARRNDWPSEAGKRGNPGLSEATMRGAFFLSRRVLLGTIVGAVLASGTVAAQGAASDALPSWNDSSAKQAIVDFVSRVTAEGGPDFVPPEERIAVFDNDGTLWAEQPIYFQVQFALARIKALAPQHPEWKETQPYKAVIEGDPEALAAAGEKGLLEIMAVTHTGMTTEAFAATVSEWLATARHPRFNQPYDRLAYQPQLELLAYLRQNGFKTFIVSGGGVEFMQVFAERKYGIPPEQVVGSSGMTKFQIGPHGKPELVKQPKVEFIDDGPGKPAGITGSSVAVRSSRSAIPTAIIRCCNGPLLATAHDSSRSSTTPTPSANGHTTAIPTSASWTRRSTRVSPGIGPSST
jgi:phosphoglycolate phosphatase-like HAD superfamily hydrolase